MVKMAAVNFSTGGGMTVPTMTAAFPCSFSPNPQPQGFSKGFQMEYKPMFHITYKHRAGNKWETYFCFVWNPRG
jgi:hypothetical protein